MKYVLPVIGAVYGNLEAYTLHIMLNRKLGFVGELYLSRKLNLMPAHNRRCRTF
jgi:hypothetical protein